MVTSLASIQHYTMYELWGDGSEKSKIMESKQKDKLDYIVHKQKKTTKRENLCCIKLNEGGYVALSGDDSVGAVSNKDMAEIFTEQEANELIRRMWLNGKIIESTIKVG